MRHQQAFIQRSRVNRRLFSQPQPPVNCPPKLCQRQLLKHQRTLCQKQLLVRRQKSESHHHSLSLSSGCSPPIITLIPDISSLSSPLAFRRSQDVSISSYLQLQCNASLATIIQWIITPCTPTCSSSALQLPSSIVTTLSELFLPARTLDYGTYQLTLTVSMTASPQSTSTATAYLKITPTPIIPNLMPFGTSMIAHGRSQDLLLDPGTNSVDPDADTFNATVSIPLIHRNDWMRPSVLTLEMDLWLLLSDLSWFRFPQH